MGQENSRPRRPSAAAEATGGTSIWEGVWEDIREPYAIILVRTAYLLLCCCRLVLMPSAADGLWL